MNIFFEDNSISSFPTHFSINFSLSSPLKHYWVFKDFSIYSKIVTLYSCTLLLKIIMLVVLSAYCGTEVTFSFLKTFTLFVPTISVFLLLLIIDVCAIFPSFMRSLSYVCHLSVCLY